MVLLYLQRDINSYVTIDCYDVVQIVAENIMNHTETNNNLSLECDAVTEFHVFLGVVHIG